MAAFNTLFRCKWLVDGSRSLPEMATKLEETAKRLREMGEAGIRLDGEVQDDYAELVTDDPAVAEKYGLQSQEDEEDEDRHRGPEEDYEEDSDGDQ